MKSFKFTMLSITSTDRILNNSSSWLIQLGTRFVREIITGSILFVATASEGASMESAESRSFNGVTATFEIKNPVLKVGEDLRINVTYRNESRRTVNFRYLHLEVDVEFYEKGKMKPLIGGSVGEPAPQEVTLEPGKSLVFEDVVYTKRWDNLVPGAYEVRFSYHLGLLLDKSLQKKYLKTYPHTGYVVPWNDRRYAFTLVK